MFDRFVHFSKLSTCFDFPPKPQTGIQKWRLYSMSDFQAVISDVRPFLQKNVIYFLQFLGGPGRSWSSAWSDCGRKILSMQADFAARCCRQLQFSWPVLFGNLAVAWYAMSFAERCHLEQGNPCASSCSSNSNTTPWSCLIWEAFGCLQQV